MKLRILAVSRINMEFIQHTDVFPETGKSVIGTTFDYMPGGKGSTAALAITALEAECILAARVGADSNGQRLRNILRDAGVDVRFVFMERRRATGIASVTATPDGNTRTVLYPGANELLSSDDVEEAFTALPDAVFVQLEAPEPAVVTATAYAAKKNIPVFIDAGQTRPDYPLDKLCPCEIFTPDENEIETYTGIAPTSTENCLRAAIRLSTLVKARYYVIKMGGRGAFLYDGKYYNVALGYDVNVVDRAAAGDIFSVALTVEYMRTKNIMHSVKYANAAGAYAVLHEGTLNSIPTMTELDEFINERGITL